MSLSDSTLSAAIQTELISQFGAVDDSATLQKYADAIAKAVVDHIKNAAVVNTTVTGTLPNGPANAQGVGTVS